MKEKQQEDKAAGTHSDESAGKDIINGERKEGRPRPPREVLRDCIFGFIKEEYIPLSRRRNGGM